MKIINSGFEILTEVNGKEILKRIERIGRICYKSEDKITDYSAENFVKMLINRGHEAMIEHESISVLITCDRGVSHEIVRHRIASYAQESTRYCNYCKDKFGNELTFIKPKFDYLEAEEVWEISMQHSERLYIDMIACGCTPQIARSVLPNSLKTELVMTTNLREWRHFFKLRTAKAAHPQMREIAIPMLNKFKELIPVVFDDINYTEA